MYFFPCVCSCSGDCIFVKLSFSSENIQYCTSIFVKSLKIAPPGLHSINTSSVAADKPDNSWQNWKKLTADPMTQIFILFQHPDQISYNLSEVFIPQNISKLLSNRKKDQPRKVFKKFITSKQNCSHQLWSHYGAPLYQEFRNTSFQT